MEEEFERGFASTGKQICRACAGEVALADVIGELADDEVACSYCDRAPAGPLDELIAHMLEAIRLEHRPASEESPPWESREGGYQARAYDVRDLLFYELREDFGSPEVLRDIEDALIPNWSRGLSASGTRCGLLSNTSRLGSASPGSPAGAETAICGRSHGPRQTLMIDLIRTSSLTPWEA